MTPRSAATASNASTLPNRYEIRKLIEEDISWISALIAHTHVFYSPVFRYTYPDDQTARAYNVYTHMDYFMRHQVNSGHSFGVFDLEYEYHTDEARKEGGKLLWNLEDTSATADDLARQMDFPLVSIAMSYDGASPLDMEQMMPVVEIVPVFSIIYHELEVRDPRDPESWKAKRPGEVLMRNGTSTRHEYEGKGIMRGMADWLIRYGAEQGFRGIQIECFAEPVTHVWTHPPEPFKATLISEFNVEDYREEQEIDGVKKEVNPFGAARQQQTKVYIDLKSSS